MATTTATETVSQILLRLLLLIELQIQRGGNGINNTTSVTSTNNTTALQNEITLLNDGVIVFSDVGVVSRKILAFHQEHRAGRHAFVILWTEGYTDKVFTT